MKLWLGLFLAIPLLADTYPRQPGIDALHYVFRLALHDETDQIEGETAITIRFVTAGVSEFALDLASRMTVDSANCGGAPVRFRHAADRLSFQLDTPPAAGETRTFGIRYHGVPGGGLLIANNKYGERTFFGLNWPDKARQWLPMIDHPYDKATSEFIVNAPAHYQVVANGLLQEETDLPDGRRLTHWKQSVPVSSWMNMIGVARFTSRHFGSARGIPLETWMYPQDRAAGIATFETPVRQAIEFYSEAIGPYPYEKLGNIEVAGMQGGTEHASAIAYGQDSVNGKPVARLVAHEIAHQWFGDSVTEKDWDDVWLSEGFATYLTLLFTEHYQGRDAFVTALRNSRETVFEVQKKLPKAAVRHGNIADMKQILNPLIYQKGGWTLHMLRGLIGDASFHAGLREYYARYRDANASTDDFRRVLEEAAGRPLGWFFEQWLNRAGWPVLEGTWRYNAASKNIEIEAKQTQAGEAYRLPLDVRIQGESDSRRLEMTGREQRFQIPADKAPVSVALDPETWLLAQIKFGKRPD